MTIMREYHGNGKISNIYESPSQIITNLVLPAGETLPTHHAPYHVTVVSVKGETIFKGQDFEAHLEPGKLIQMTPDELHSLTAITDSELMVIKSKLAE
jgi:quercetin dioxygenase-like cupin family protein